MKNPYKTIPIYYIRDVIVKNLSDLKVNSVNPLYLIINEINEYIEESNRNKYLTLISTDQSKDVLKSMKNYGPK